MTDAAGDATALLRRVGTGDRAAAERLLPLVHEELRRLAKSFLRREHRGQTYQTTALIDDAFMRLIGQHHVRWQSRAHFYAIAAQAIRRLLVDHARRRNAAKRGGGWERITLADADRAPGSATVDVLALEEALDRLGRLDERQARVVELRFFGGLGVEETAEVLGVSPRTVESDWHMARAWLRRELGEEGTA